MEKLRLSMPAATTDVVKAFEDMPQLHVRMFCLGLMQRLYGSLQAVAATFVEHRATGIPLHIFVNNVAVFACSTNFNTTDSSAFPACGDELLHSIQHEESETPANTQPPRISKAQELSTLQFQYEVTSLAETWYAALPPNAVLQNIDVFSCECLVKVGLWELFCHIDKAHRRVVTWIETLMSLLDVSMKLKKNVPPVKSGYDQVYSQVLDRLEPNFTRVTKIVHAPLLNGYFLLVAGNGKSRKQHLLKLVSDVTLHTEREYVLLENAGHILSMCFLPMQEGVVCLGFSDGRTRFIDASSGLIRLTFPAYRCVLPDIAAHAAQSANKLHVFPSNGIPEKGHYTSNNEDNAADHICGQNCPYVIREDTHLSASSLLYGPVNDHLVMGCRLGQLRVVNIYQCIGPVGHSAQAMQQHNVGGGAVPKVVWSEKLHSAAVTSIVFLSADQKQIATGSLDCSVVLVHLSHQYKYRKLKGHCSGISKMVYNPLFCYIISTGMAECEPFCWSVNVSHAKPLPLRDGKSSHVHPVSGIVNVDFSEFVLTIDLSGMVKMWSLSSLACIQTIGAKEGRGAGGNWSVYAFNQPKQQLLLSSSMRVVMLAYGSVAPNTDPHAATCEPIKAALFLNCKTRFVTATRRELKLWCALEGCVIASSTFDEELTAMCCRKTLRQSESPKQLTPDEADPDIIYLGTVSGKVLCYDFLRMRVLRKYQHPSGFPISFMERLQTEANVNRVAVVSSEGALQIVTDSFVELTMTGAALHREADDVTAVAVDTVNSFLLVGSSTNRVSVYCTKTLQMVNVCQNKPSRARVTCVVPLRPHLFFASADDAGGLFVWMLIKGANGFTSRLAVRGLTNQRKGVCYTPVVSHLGWVGEGHSLLVAADDAGGVSCYHLSLLHRSLVLGDILALWEGCANVQEGDDTKKPATFLTDGSLHPSLLIEDMRRAKNFSSEMFLPEDFNAELNLRSFFTLTEGRHDRNDSGIPTCASLQILGVDDPAVNFCIFAAVGCSAIIHTLKGEFLASLARERDSLGSWGVDLFSADRNRFDGSKLQTEEGGTSVVTEQKVKRTKTRPKLRTKPSFVKSRQSSAQSPSRLRRSTSEFTLPSMGSFDVEDRQNSCDFAAAFPAASMSKRDKDRNRNMSPKNSRADAQQIDTKLHLPTVNINEANSINTFSFQTEPAEELSPTGKGVVDPQNLRSFRSSLKSDLSKLQRRLSRVSKTTPDADPLPEEPKGSPDMPGCALMGAAYSILKPMFSQIDALPYETVESPDVETTTSDNNAELPRKQSIHCGVGVTANNDFVIGKDVRPYNYKLLLKEYKYKEVSYRKSISLSRHGSCAGGFRGPSPVRLLFKVAHGDLDSDSEAEQEDSGSNDLAERPLMRESSARHHFCEKVLQAARRKEGSTTHSTPKNQTPERFQLDAGDEPFVFPDMSSQAVPYEEKPFNYPYERCATPSEGGSSEGSNFCENLPQICEPVVDAVDDVHEGLVFESVRNRSKTVDVKELQRERKARLKEERRQLDILRKEKVASIVSNIQHSKEGGGQLTLQSISDYTARSSFVLSNTDGRDTRMASADATLPPVRRQAADKPDKEDKEKEQSAALHRSSSAVMRHERDKFMKFLRNSACTSRLPQLSSGKAEEHEKEKEKEKAHTEHATVKSLKSSAAGSGGGGSRKSSAMPARGSAVTSAASRIKKLPPMSSRGRKSVTGNDVCASTLLTAKAQQMTAKGQRRGKETAGG